MNKEVKLEVFLRWTSIAAIVIAAIVMLNYLSNVLLPFFAAWAIAYLLYPTVKFVQYKMKVTSRVLSIIITLIFVTVAIGGTIALISGSMIAQLKQLGEYLNTFVQMHTHSDSVSMYIRDWLSENKKDIEGFFSEADLPTTIQALLPELWKILSHTYSAIKSFGVVILMLLYLFFILLDYEYLTKNWIKIFPKNIRPFWQNVASEVEIAMSNYARGQSLVALTMGVLFCIGFTIIDFPMAIGLGILIGIMDLVPYLHTFALIPTAFLALMKAANTGDNFFLIFGGAIAVFCIVQVIIDLIVTPKIMGKAMGLNPAILLLSLSVWGSILGFIGLIIALPLTAILFVYYQRYITKEEAEETSSESNTKDEHKK